MSLSLKDYARGLLRLVRGRNKSNLSNQRPRPRQQSAVRIGVLGLGVIGENHARQLASSNFFSLTAIATRDVQKKRVASQLGCEYFSSLDAMLSGELVDAVLIATPHPLHCQAAVVALAAGVHVICEKPLSLTTADADSMIDAAASSKATLTVVSQNRFEPSYRAAKEMLDSGKLGAVRRCSITESFWRSNAYYRSAGWRGTWAGEGGGVLVNQAPHVIDRYVWLCGRPAEVTAVCDTVLHDITVEDTATLLFRHDNGLQGHIHVSTNECPPLSRLEIACDKGRVTVHNGAITIERLSRSIKQETGSTSEASGNIDSTTEHRGGTLLNWSPELLHRFYEDFAQGIWSGRPSEVTAQQGRDVVEIMNAGHLSSFHKTHIQLPIDRQQYAEFQASMADKEVISR